jgi:ASC-1-like (ASCH) protein
MKTYRSHRTEPYFTFIKNGQKTIEGRVRKGKYRLIKSGDMITVYNKEETDSVNVRVKRVSMYPSIKDLLESEGVERVLPDVDNIKQGIEIYRRFYTPEQESIFGMVAIEVKVI